MYHLIVILIAFIATPSGDIREKAQVQVVPDHQYNSLTECRASLREDNSTQAAVGQAVGDVGKFVDGLTTPGELIRVSVKVRCIRVSTSTKAILEQEGLR